MSVNELALENERLKSELEEYKKRYQSLCDFMSGTSHELRTPVNSIIGLCELGMEEGGSEYLSQIKENAEYQLSIISDILDMARLQGGAVVLYPEAVSLESFADSLNAVTVPLMKKKDIDFNFEFHDIFAGTLVMDKLRVKQILLNLLSNAAKFTPERGRVDMTVSQLPAPGEMVSTVFTVRDNGIGMSKEFLEKIFLPFTQERTAATASIQGSGLGLTISKRLTELMGGTMTVSSKPGEGTEFTVELTLKPAGEEGDISLGSSGTLDLSGKRALVADDHSINRILEVKLLKKAGMEAEAVNNGFECLKKFMASGPGYYDLILMDVKMPVMDGLEAARRIRELNRSDAQEVKMIAMSANAYPEDEERSRAAGMDGHIGKPVIPTVLFSDIARVLGIADRKGKVKT